MEDTNNDLKRYIAVLRHWAWLLILCLVLGAVAGFLVSQYTTPVYQAETKAMISRAPQNQSSDVTASLNPQQLTETYVQLLKTKSVLDTTAQRLGLKKVYPDAINAQSITNTQIITITVEDVDPKQAVLIADTLVAVLIEQNDSIQMGRYTSMEESLNAQKGQLETQIASLQNQIDQASIQSVDQQKKWIQDQITALQTEQSTLQQDVAALVAAGNKPGQNSDLDVKQARLGQIQALLPVYQQSYNDLVVFGKPVQGASTPSDHQLALLRTTQSLYQQIYSSVLNNLESVRLAAMNNTSNVVQIEDATAAEIPVRPRKLLNTALAGLAGLIIAGAGVFLKEYFDDTLKTSGDVERIAGLSVIGHIAEMRLDENSPDNLYVARQPLSPISEAFRSLRTNLEFAAVDSPMQTFLITSPGSGEGKSMVSCNLATSIAQGGKKVVLIDTDLRRPRVHRYTGISSNRVGLSDLFRGHLSIKDVKHAKENVPGLEVITSGNLPPNPTELLNSAKMKQILDEVKSQADFVILDCPPLIVADSQVLSAKVDGVLVVVYPGHTHREALKATINLLNRAGAKILGVVVNRIPRDSSSYYGGYYYSSYGKGYNHYAEKGEKRSRRKKKTDAPDQQ